VRFIQCRQDDLVLSEDVDFVLTMYVAHEVPDRGRFFRQIRDMLKPSGRYLLAEPKFHVKKHLFETICTQARSAGLKKVGEPAIRSSRTAVFVTADYPSGSGGSGSAGSVSLRTSPVPAGSMPRIWL
jgi:SAM-dependent methyltransferase